MLQGSEGSWKRHRSSSTARKKVVAGGGGARQTSQGRTLQWVIILLLRPDAFQQPTRSLQTLQEKKTQRWAEAPPKTTQLGAPVPSTEQLRKDQRLYFSKRIKQQ